MRTIDHRYFPHVIDIIIDSLDYLGLVAARNVCKDWRRRTTTRITRHVHFIFRENLTLEILAFHPAHPTVQLVLLSEPALQGLGEEGDPYAAYRWQSRFQINQAKELLSSTQSADASGRDRRLEDDDELLSELTWINDTWRLRDPPPKDHCYLISRETVFFRSLRYGPRSYPVNAIDCHCSPNHLIFNYDCFTDPTLRVLGGVLNTEWDKDAIASSVLILNDKRARFAPAAGISLGIVYAYLRVLRRGPECTQLSVVGLERFFSTSQSYSDYLEKFFDEAVDAAWDDGLNAESFKEYLRFYSHDEYKEMVGEESYLLHTRRSCLCKE